MFTDEMFYSGSPGSAAWTFPQATRPSSHLPLLSVFLSRVQSLVLLEPRWWGGRPWASAPSPLRVLGLALQVGHVSGQQTPLTHVSISNSFLRIFLEPKMCVQVGLPLRLRHVQSRDREDRP